MFQIFWLLFLLAATHLNFVNTTECVIPEKPVTFTCTKAGRFPNPNDINCASYYLCSLRQGKYITTLSNCPKGSLFDPKLTTCNKNYVCNCTKADAKTTTTTPKPTTTTEKPTTTTAKKPTTKKPNTTTQKPTTTTQKPTTTITTTTTNPCVVPKEPVDFKCKAKGRIDDPNDPYCSNYYICSQLHNGSYIAKYYTCPEGSAFDPSDLICRVDYECPCVMTTTTKETTTTDVPTTTTVITTTEQDTTTTEDTTTTDVPTEDDTTLSTTTFVPRTTTDPCRIPKKPVVFNCENKGRFFNENDAFCRTYFLCSAISNGSYNKTLYRCPTGAFFDPSIQLCNYGYVCPCLLPLEPFSSTTEMSSTTVAMETTTVIDTTTVPSARGTTKDPCDIPEEPIDFECTQKGRFMHDMDPYCHSYYVCSQQQDGTFDKSLYMCPNGSLYDTKKRICSTDYKCGCTLDEEVTTDATIIPSTPLTEITTMSNVVNTTTRCGSPPKPGNFVCSAKGRFQNPNDQYCTSYFLCNKLRSGKFIQTLYKCPINSFFDPSLHICSMDYKCDCSMTTTDVPVKTTTEMFPSSPLISTTEKDTTTTDFTTKEAVTSTTEQYTTTAGSSTTEAVTTTTQADATTEDYKTTTTDPCVVPTKPVEFKCEAKGRFDDPNEPFCKSYFMCSQLRNGSYIKSKYECPSGSFFDTTRLICNANYMCACSSTPTQVPTSTTPESKTTTDISTTTEQETTTDVPSTTVSSTTEQDTTTAGTSTTEQDTTTADSSTTQAVTTPTQADTTTEDYKTTTTQVPTSTTPGAKTTTDIITTTEQDSTTTTQAVTTTDTSTTPDQCDEQKASLNPVDFKCTAKGRYENVNDIYCGSYYLCNKLRSGKFVRTLYNCPRGSYFDQSMQLCNINYKCKCTKDSTTPAEQDTTTTGTSTTEQDTTTAGTSNTESASTSAGTSTTEAVTITTQVDTTTEDYKTTTTFPCVVLTKPVEFKCKAKGRFDDPNEPLCKSYFMCSQLRNGSYIKSKYECPSGSFFDPTRLICNANYKCACSSTPTQVPTSTTPKAKTTTNISTTTEQDTTTDVPTTVSSITEQDTTGTSTTEQDTTTADSSTTQAVTTPTQADTTTEEYKTTTTDPCVVPTKPVEFKCEANGRFDDPNEPLCKSYFMCSQLRNGSYIKSKYECPSGSYFDTTRLICNATYKCDCSSTSTEVPTSTTPGAKTTTDILTTTEQDTTTDVPTTTVSSTTKQDTTTAGTSTTEQDTTTAGSSTTADSSTTQAVTTPTQAETTTEDYKTTTTDPCVVPTKPVEFKCQAKGRFDDPNEPFCKSYFVCSQLSNGSYTKSKYECPFGSFFDPTILVCNVDYKCACSSTPTQVPTSTTPGAKTTTDISTTTNQKTTTDVPTTTVSSTTEQDTTTAGTSTTEQDTTTAGLSTTEAVTTPTQADPTTEDYKTTTTDPCVVPTKPVEFKCKAKGRFDDPNEPLCKSYFMCSQLRNGSYIKSKYECPSGSFFDTTRLICNANYKCACSSTPTQVPTSTTPGAKTTTDVLTTTQQDTTTDIPTTTVLSTTEQDTTTAGTSTNKQDTTTAGVSTTEAVTTPRQADTTTEDYKTTTTDPCVVTTKPVEFKCKAKGRFDDPNEPLCKSYFMCSQLRNGSYIKSKYECPSGSFFDSTRLICNANYKCACSSTSTQVPTSTTPGASTTEQDTTTAATSNTEPASTSAGTSTTEQDTTTAGTSTTEQDTTTAGTSTTEQDTTTAATSYTEPDSTSSGTSTTEQDTTTAATSYTEPASTSAGTSTTEQDTTTAGTSTTEQDTTTAGTSTTEQDTTTAATSNTEPASTSAGTSTTEQDTTTAGTSYTEPASTSAGTSTTEQDTTTAGTSTTEQDTTTAGISTTEQDTTTAGTSTTEEDTTTDATSYTEPASTSAGTSTTEQDETTDVPTTTTQAVTTADTSTTPDQCDEQKAWLNPVDFKCTAEGRYENVNDIYCGSYYLCNKLRSGKFVRTLYTCPHGSYFDESIELCNVDYKCKCTKDATTPAEKDTTTAEQDTTTAGTATTEQDTTTAGTSTTEAVTATTQVDTTTEDYKTTTTDPCVVPTKPVEFKCKAKGRFDDPNEPLCKSYFMCSQLRNGSYIKSKYECPSESFFDTTRLICNANYKCACSSTPTQVPTSTTPESKTTTDISTTTEQDTTTDVPTTTVSSTTEQDTTTAGTSTTEQDTTTAATSYTEPASTSAGISTIEQDTTTSGTSTTEQDTTTAGTSTTEQDTTTAGTSTTEQDTTTAGTSYTEPASTSAATSTTEQETTTSATSTTEKDTTTAGTSTTEQDTTTAATSYTEPASTSAGTSTTEQDTTTAGTSTTELDTTTAGTSTTEQDTTAAGTSYTEPASTSAATSTTEQETTTSATSTTEKDTTTAGTSTTEQDTTTAGTSTTEQDTTTAGTSTTKEDTTTAATSYTEPASTSAGTSSTEQDTTTAGTSTTEQDTTTAGTSTTEEDTTTDATSYTEPASTSAGTSTTEQDETTDVPTTTTQAVTTADTSTTPDQCDEQKASLNPVDFKCTAEGRYENVNDIYCGSYYLCNQLRSGKFVRTLYTCPPGSYFDQRIELCNVDYKCKCTKDATTPAELDTTTAGTSTTEQGTTTAGSSNTEPASTSAGTSTTEAVTITTQVDTTTEDYKTTTTDPCVVPTKPVEFKCEANGRFDDPNEPLCKSYFMCSQLRNGSYIKSKYECPSGSFFDTRRLICNANYKCACSSSPTQVPTSTTPGAKTTTDVLTTTQENTTIDIPTTTVSSTTEQDTTTAGTSTTEQDTTTTGSSTTQAVTTPTQADTTTEDYKTTTTDPCVVPTKPVEFKCEANGRFDDPNEPLCKSYFMCSQLRNGSYIKSKYECPSGSFFDTTRLICNANYKCACSSTPTEVPTSTTPGAKTTTDIMTTTEQDSTTNVPTTTTQAVTTTDTSTTPDQCDEQKALLNPVDFKCTAKGRYENVNDIYCGSYYLCNKLRSGKFVRTLYNCPQGSYFDQSIQLCNINYKCKCTKDATTPPEKNTTTAGTTTTEQETTTTEQETTTVVSTTTQSSTTPDECEELKASLKPVDYQCSAKGRYENVNDIYCGSYYLCNKLRSGKFKRTLYKCPSGSFFDQSIQLCNTDYKCKCSNNTTKTTEPTTIKPTSTTTENLCVEPKNPIEYKCTKSGKYADPNNPFCTSYYLCSFLKNEFVTTKYVCPAGSTFDPIKKICSKNYQCACKK